METEVARKIENSVATIPGIKHIYTKSRTARRRSPRVPWKPIQPAVDDVRDAVRAPCADLPGDLRDPVVAKSSLSGAPILTYTIAGRPDDEALSWFVDNAVTKRPCRAVRGVGAVASRVGGVTREVRVDLGPGAPAGLGATTADISRQAPDPAGSPPRRVDVGGASSRCAPSPPCRAPPNWRRWRSRWPTAAASGSTRWRSDTVAQRRRRCSTAAGGRLRDHAQRRRRDRRGARRRAELERLRADHDLVVTEAFNFGRPGARRTSTAR